MPSYARRVAYNTIVQIIGRVLTTVTSLATVSSLNSALKPERWGSYVAISTYLGFFAVVADMGLNLLYLREISREPENVDAITARFFGFRIVTAGFVLLVCAPALALLIPIYREFILPILLLSIGQFVLTLNQSFVTIAQARLMMDRAIVSDFLGRITILLGTIGVLLWAPNEQRLLYAVAVVVGGSLVNLAISYVLVRKLAKISIKFDLREWPRIFAEVLPLGALAVLGMIHFKSDSLILTFYQPVTDVGIYGNAYKILEILITLPGMFVGGLFPEMTQLIKRGMGELASMMQKAFDLLLFAVVPLVTLIVLLAPLLIAILTRENIDESARSLQILAFAMPPLFIGTLMAHVLIAHNRQRILSAIELVAVVLNIGLNIYLIPRYTYYGAGATTVVSEILTTCVTTYVVARRVGFIPNLKTLWPAALGALLMISAYVAALGANAAWISSYATWSRFIQAGVLGVIVGVGLIVYVLPFVVFKQFPPVLQRRLEAIRWRGGAE